MEIYMRPEYIPYARWKNRFEQIVDQNQAREADVIVHDYDTLDTENETANRPSLNPVSADIYRRNDGWGVRDAGY